MLGDGVGGWVGGWVNGGGDEMLLNVGEGWVGGWVGGCVVPYLHDLPCAKGSVYRFLGRLMSSVTRFLLDVAAGGLLGRRKGTAPVERRWVGGWVGGLIELLRVGRNSLPS